MSPLADALWEKREVSYGKEKGKGAHRPRRRER
jgi:hypothetical protein